MPELRWTGRGTFSHRTGMYGPGERVDVDDSVAEEFLAHWSDGWERVDGEADESAVDESGDDGVTAPVDPSDYTVAELRDHLSDSDYSDPDLVALREAEETGKDRETALEAIDSARGD